MSNILEVEQAKDQNGQQSKLTFPALTIMWHPNDVNAPVRINYNSEDFASLDLVLGVLNMAAEQIKAVMAVNRSVMVSNHLRQQALEQAKEHDILRQVARAISPHAH
jgi:hypothetical protein